MHDVSRPSREHFQQLDGQTAGLTVWVCRGGDGGVVVVVGGGAALRVRAAGGA